MTKWSFGWILDLIKDYSVFWRQNFRHGRSYKKTQKHGAREQEKLYASSLFTLRQPRCILRRNLTMRSRTWLPRLRRRDQFLFSTIWKILQGGRLGCSEKETDIIPGFIEIFSGQLDSYVTKELCSGRGKKTAIKYKNMRIVYSCYW